MTTTRFPNDKYSIEQLEHAVRIIARVIALYGDTYLPIFDRLHAELIQAKEREAQKSVALELAMRYSDSR